MHQLAKSIDQNMMYIVPGKSTYVQEIEKTIGYKALKFVKNFVDIYNSSTSLITEQFDSEHQYKINGTTKSLIYLYPISKKDFTSSFVNILDKKIPIEGMFVGRIDKQIAPKQLYLKKRIISNLSALDKKNNMNRKLLHTTKGDIAETIFRKKIHFFGRLGYLGFDILSEAEIGSFIYFVAKKTTNTSDSPKPSSSPLIRLRRIGKYGKIITIFKIRTMYQYSEYLQDYIYKNNKLQSGGKFKNDKRISKIGNFLRKYWIDELPMIINILKGDIKLVGVRPLSRQYFNLYPDDLKNLRTQFKPGLIPPYYADMPASFEEIVNSEQRYLMAYKEKPLQTDLKYLAKALYNIIIKFKRSK